MKWLLDMRLKYCIVVLLLTALVSLAALYVLLERVDERPYNTVKRMNKESSDRDEKPEHTPDYIIEEEQEAIPWSENFKELDGELQEI